MSRRSQCRPTAGDEMQRIFFYGLLILPIIAWAILVIPHYVFGADEVSAAVVGAVAYVSPIITGDLSLFGELTPAILATAIITLLPSGNTKVSLLAIAIILVGYVLFIHLSIFFSSGPGSALLAANFPDPTQAQRTIVTVVSNVRVMEIVTAAALFGFKLKER